MTRRLQLSTEHGFTMVAVMLVMLATSILGGRGLRGRRRRHPVRPRLAGPQAGVRGRRGRASSTTCTSSRATTTTGRNCDDVEDPGDGRPSPVNKENPGADRTWRSLSSTRREVLDRAAARQGRGRVRQGRPRTTMLEENSGAFRIRSTGVSRGIKRSIVTTLRRTSFLDYLYFTDYEASDPNSFASTTDQNTARTLLRAVPRDPQPERRGAATTSTSRSRRWDGIHGPLHTNDDLLTCGSPDFGRDGEEDVIEIHGPAPGGYTRSGGSGCAGTPDFYGPVRQPAGAPAGADLQHGAAPGAPPPTTSSRARPRSRSTARSNMTVVTYPNGVAHRRRRRRCPPNGVIYVEKNGACSLQAPRQIDYGVAGEWRCAILIVHGTYPKSMTLGSEDDILIDGDLRANEAKPVLGPDRPALRARQARRQGRLRREQHHADRLAGPRADELPIEAAILALKDSFVVDNYQCGDALGTLTVVRRDRPEVPRPGRHLQRLGPQQRLRQGLQLQRRAALPQPAVLPRSDAGRVARRSAPTSRSRRPSKHPFTPTVSDRRRARLARARRYLEMVDDPAGAAGGRNLMHRMAKGAFLALALAGAVLAGCGGGGSSEKERRQRSARRGQAGRQADDAVDR